VKLPSLVKIPKHKQFDFAPRYYDEQKEELLERVEKIKREYKATNNKEIGYVPNVNFGRVNKKNKFQFGIQLYLIVFMLFDLLLLFKADNISNQYWGLILIMQVTAVYLKVKFGKKKEL